MARVDGVWEVICDDRLKCAFGCHSMVSVLVGRCVCLESESANVYVVMLLNAEDNQLDGGLAEDSV